VLPLATLLMQLRAACTHPALLPPASGEEEEGGILQPASEGEEGLLATRGCFVAPAISGVDALGAASRKMAPLLEDSAARGQTLKALNFLLVEAEVMSRRDAITISNTPAPSKALIQELSSTAKPSAASSKGAGDYKAQLSSRRTAGRVASVTQMLACNATRCAASPVFGEDLCSLIRQMLACNATRYAASPVFSEDLCSLTRQ
ncbi:hypothetical protein T484DRAFT_1769827, partial [Baffinella frigidus]